MTAEIAIFNAQAIALAADSAVTSEQAEGRKIFTSANKLFALSRYHPVAIMIYGNAHLMGVPWETIVKVYRSRILRTQYPSLQDYARDFMNFFGSDLRLFPEDAQTRYVRDIVDAYLALIWEEIKHAAEELLNRDEEVTGEDMSRIIQSIVKQHYDIWEGSEVPETMPAQWVESLEQKYGDLIRASISATFDYAELDQFIIDQLVRISASLFAKFPPEFEGISPSGVVIAGFGQDDIYPSLCSFMVDGVVNGRGKYRQDRRVAYNDGRGARIIPFAQIDMVCTFMEGVEPDYEKVIESFLLQTIRDLPAAVIDSIDGLEEESRIRAKAEWGKQKTRDIFSQYEAKLRQYRAATHVSHVMKVVDLLPKDELAAMAETLVNLTSFKRRMSMSPETVGGPIDVAVISKGDGLIWMKRKHYFNPELNPHFFANHYQEAQQ